MTVPVPTGRRVFFIAPHQDDETISMGQIIAHHALVGRRCSAVIGSMGETTTAIHSINGTVSNGWWGGKHDLALEGYEPLTQEHVGIARDLEFIQAAGALGVLPEEVRIPSAPRISSSVTPADYVATATAVLLELKAIDPTAGFYTMHRLDIDPMHAAYGQALLNLYNADPVAWNDVRWVVRQAQAVSPLSDPDHIVAEQYAVPGDKIAEAKLMVRHAARAYEAWAPRAARYAVGYHSVGLSLWPDVVAGNPNWIVRPS